MIVGYKVAYVILTVVYDEFSVLVVVVLNKVY